MTGYGYHEGQHHAWVVSGCRLMDGRGRLSSAGTMAIARLANSACWRLIHT
ncbi:hypothetical protein [Komagataeibacter saccharivorans]|uniref:hypothetical protein n=1 Tax=Komagataeibacter saccharivorans TaxID=265959 RepID=UPI0015E8C8A5|nr:hypothetical protein [Komagataeibacter saccharivorans]